MTTAKGDAMTPAPADGELRAAGPDLADPASPTGADTGGGAAPNGNGSGASAAPTTKPGDGARGLRDSGPRGGRLGPTGWLRWFWRQLTSMRTALILLFLLALASVPGSVLPQEGIDPAAVTQYYQSHPSLAPIFNR